MNLEVSDLIVSGRIIFKDNTTQDTSSTPLFLKCSQLERNSTTGVTSFGNDSLNVNQSITVGNQLTSNFINSKGLAFIEDLDLNGLPAVQNAAFSSSLKTKLNDISAIVDAPNKRIKLTHDSDNSIEFSTSGLTFQVDGVNTSKEYGEIFPDLSPFATTSYVDSEIAAITAPDLSSYATTSYVDTEIATIAAPDLSAYATTSYVDTEIAAIPAPDLSSYATTSYVDTEIAAIPAPDLSSYATTSYVDTEIAVPIDSDSRFAQSYIDSKVLYLSTVLSNYATTSYVDTEIAAIPAPDLSSYATTSYVNTEIAAIPAPDLSSYATTSYVDTEIAAISTPDLSSYATTSYVDTEIATIPAPDLSSYATTSYVDTEIAAIPAPDLSAYAVLNTNSLTNYTTTTLLQQQYATKDYAENYTDTSIATIPAPDLSSYATTSYVDTEIAAISAPDLSSYATTSYVDTEIAAIPAPDLSSYATTSYVDTEIAAIPAPDLSSYATTSYVDTEIAAIPAPDLSSYATTSYVDTEIAAIPAPDLSSYATTSDVNDAIAAIPPSSSYVVMLMWERSSSITNGTYSFQFNSTNATTSPSNSTHTYWTTYCVTQQVTAFDLQCYLRSGNIIGTFSLEIGNENGSMQSLVLDCDGGLGSTSVGGTSGIYNVANSSVGEVVIPAGSYIGLHFVGSGSNSRATVTIKLRYTS
jgi:uncharacterized membrane protein YczE